jgi:hypothetical protein
MSKPIRRLAAAVLAALALGIGSAAWAASSASAAPVSAGSAPSAVKACTASQLSVWISPDAINGAAGTWFYPLEFTNISKHACATGGYPGVSAIGPGGKQLGLAAGRNPLYKGKVVTIPAGGTAHALFAYGNAEVSTSGCKPKAAAELKVYPPNSKVAIRAFFDLPACTVGGHVYLRVAVIQPGTNI